MSTCIVGFVPPDKKWKEMKAIYDACIKAGIEIPKEVDHFFDGCEPSDHGAEVNEKKLKECGAVRDFSNDYSTGFEVEIANLPKHVKVLRFYNAW